MSKSICAYSIWIEQWPLTSIGVSVLSSFIDHHNFLFFKIRCTYIPINVFRNVMWFRIQFFAVDISVYRVVKTSINVEPDDFCICSPFHSHNYIPSFKGRMYADGLPKTTADEYSYFFILSLFIYNFFLSVCIDKISILCDCVVTINLANQCIFFAAYSLENRLGKCYLYHRLPRVCLIYLVIHGKCTQYQELSTL